MHRPQPCVRWIQDCGGGGGGATPFTAIHREEEIDYSMLHSHTTSMGTLRIVDADLNHRTVHRLSRHGYPATLSPERLGFCLTFLEDNYVYLTLPSLSPFSSTLPSVCLFSSRYLPARINATLYAASDLYRYLRHCSVVVFSQTRVAHLRPRLVVTSSTLRASTSWSKGSARFEGIVRGVFCSSRDPLGRFTGSVFKNLQSILPAG